MKLAPAVMLRIAAWPADTLQPFGDAELGQRARSRDGDIGPLYAEVMARDRAILREKTAEDPRFVRAMWIANPVLAAKLDRAGGAPTKRVRHLETTLYRHLARATGRATPCDCWSGVTLARFGEKTEITALPERVVLAPDLRPFQAILRQLGARPIYRARARWAANPTIRAHEGGWNYWARQPIGPAIQRTIDANPLVAAILERTPARGERLMEGAFAEAFSALVDHGFLVGGLDLPVRFTSPWRALEVAGRRLLPEHRAPWSAALSRLRSIADRVAQLRAPMPELVREAEDTVALLARALGADVMSPRAVLRADLLAPLSVTLGPQIAASLAKTIERYDAFQAEFGLGLAFRADARARFPARTDDLRDEDASLPLSATGATWESIATGREVIRRLARWRALIQGRSPGGSTDAIAPPPLGCMMLSPTTGAPWIHGVIDEPTIPYARFAWALDDDPLAPWFRDRWRTLARTAGLELREYATWAEAHPNVAARPLLTRRTIEPWTAHGSRDLSVVLENNRLIARTRGRELAVASFVSAPAIGDPIARILFPTTFRETPTHAIVPSAVPFRFELERGGASPAISLEDGSLVRTRRVYLEGEALRSLARSRGHDRFSRWQKLAADHDLPPEVLVRRDTDSPVILVRDSPLALDAVLEGAADHVTRILFEAPPIDPPWLVAPDGKRYISELAIPFERSSHAWDPCEDRS